MPYFPQLSERILKLRLWLPAVLLVAVMVYEVTRHLLLPDAGHPVLFAIDLVVFGLGAPAGLWLTLSWIGYEMRAREQAEARADTRTRLQLEMQHRIRNNLQTVADLLTLELARVPHPSAAQSLQDSVTRIKTIAAAHELLSADQIAAAALLPLAQRVAENTRVTLCKPHQTITLRVTGASALLDSKAATAFALVVNELVSNAIEHGLDGRDGEIEIRIGAEAGQARVVVQDSGVGLGENLDAVRAGEHRAALGLRIVRTLVEKDLGGRFVLENRRALGAERVGGARAEFWFPLQNN